MYIIKSQLTTKKIFPWLLVIPILVFFFVWNLFPILWMMGLSFYHYNFTFGMPARFVGLKNYYGLVNDYSFWRHLSLTFIFVIESVGIETILGVLLGYFFWKNSYIWGRRLAMTFLFSPMMLTPVAVGTFFKLNYSPDYGIIPYFAKLFFGVNSLNLLGSGTGAYYAVLAVDVWMWTPFIVLMTIAALGAVPNHLLESARVDKLAFTDVLKYILWPNAKYIILLGVLLRTIQAFKTSSLVSAMTSGGPGSATMLAPIEVYQQGFSNFNIGQASTMAIVVLFIAIAFTSIFIFVLNKRPT